jgi:FRG domain
MTWAKILALVTELSEQIRSDGSVPWFRGHRLASWLLESSLHRYVKRFTSQFTKPISAADMRDLLRGEYKSIYRQFKVDTWSLLDSRERIDWGVVFAMQHFGLPTRLLDWTESFAAAVFFAQDRRKPTDDASIWVLDPQCLNKVSIGAYGIVALEEDPAAKNVFPTYQWHPRWKPPAKNLRTIAASPLYTNPRMVAQRSAFTVSGDTFQALDRQFPSLLVKHNRLVKIILPAATFHDAELFLDRAGLDAFNFFPDLQGIAMKHGARAERRIRDAKQWYPQFFK